MTTLPNLPFIADPQLRLALENVYRLLQSNAEGDLSGIYPNLTVTSARVKSDETGLKIIRGTIDTSGSGTIVRGTGFTINRTATGVVTVTYTTAFSAAPSPVASSEWHATIVDSVTTTATRVRLFDDGAVARDGVFQFTAIGPA